MKIFNSHSENIMLEFTATIDLSNEFINEKYTDKIIYKYDLKEFRLWWYSKEVDIFKSDMTQEERILQALILSQYRLKIAEKYKIFCKPVILFKAQKTVAESENNMMKFTEQVKNLNVNNILIIKAKADGIMKEAFEYFIKNNITDDELAEELKRDFHETNCISANDDKEANNNQILLNTLEDKTNKIRAVFAVQKLNEWWDVLNLFDIVRLYESRSNVIDKKSWKVIVWPQTISEAQLIGRWARYFPFTTSESIWQNKYQRKFDWSIHELKILETFYYHTTYDNLYIAEIRQALKEIWMVDEKEKKPFRLKLKESFVQTEFYTQWAIYINERKEKWSDHIDSLDKVWISLQTFDVELVSGVTDTITIFDDKKKEEDKKNEWDPKTMSIKDINKNIVRKALWQNDFYAFDNLQKHIWWLTDMDEFMTSEKYLWWIKICFKGTQEALNHITNDQKLQAIHFVLKQIEPTIKSQEVQYYGTKEFQAKSLKDIFHREKDIFVDLWAEEISKDKERFVFEKITGTSEEKDFIELFHRKVEGLKTKYDEIYLIRSERAFALYSFDDWQRFEPDFVLFLRNVNNKDTITYQVFIEQKGNQFKDSNNRFENSKEWRKQKFLIELESKHEFLDLNFGNYRLIWLPFYNKDLEMEFEKSMDNVL